MCAITPDGASADVVVVEANVSRRELAFFASRKEVKKVSNLALDRQIVEHTSRGWKVVSRSETQAQLVKGKPTSHLLHLVLSLLTVGLWIPVWILVTLAAGEKTKLISA